MSQSSYVSSNDPRLHFGLGAVSAVDIEVRWPLGLVEQHKNIAANQLVALHEGSGQIKTEPLANANASPKQSNPK